MSNNNCTGLRYVDSDVFTVFADLAFALAD